MKRFFNKIKPFLFPFLILIIVSVIGWKNYIPGTYLSGWDTLHPEFNLGLYLKRIFFGVWQEHQGLGSVASQAHASELPRMTIIFLLSKLLPQFNVRYFFFCISLGVGALGIYFFVYYLIAINKNKYLDVSSFLASLFYIFNLTTVQQFYVPLEMFAVHYATIPWLFLFATRFLREGKKRLLIWFSIITIFSASMAHTSTLFYVYLITFLIYIVGVIFFVRKKYLLKRGFILIFLTVLLNLYWILPNIYWIKNCSKEVEESKISTIFSDEAFLQGKSFGDLNSLSLSKNFLFNWREYSFKENTFVDLLDEWKTHLDLKYIKEIGYGIFSIAILGIVISFFSKSAYIWSLFPLLLTSIFFWINSNPPFEAIFDYLRNNSDLFKEGLRFPFTKFSILLIFCLSTYFGFSLQFIFEKVKKFSGLLLIIIFSCLVYFGLPALQGFLISPSMKVNIPSDYFEVFNYFSEQNPSKRVAKIPLNTFWGWNYYSWNYQGAGFTWFGIPQPTLDREFDRWSSFNESFYNQASYYLYNKDLELFEKTLEKYQVKYLLLDESLVNAGGNSKLLFIPEIKEMISKSERIKEIEKIGFLSIYETDFNLEENYIFSPENYVRLNVDQNYSQIDPIYEKFGTYVFDKKGITYPFVNFDKRGSLEIFEDKDFLNFKNGDIKAMFPLEEKITEDFSLNRGFKEAYNCDLKKIGEVWKEIKYDGVWYKALGSGVSCDFFDYSNLSYDQGYALRIKGKNLKGRSLKIYLYNKKTTRMDLEELLPNGEFDEYFVVLPTTKENEKEDKGYTLNLETRSFGKVASENMIELIEFVPVDINFLTSLVTEPESVEIITNNLNVTNTYKFGTSNYLVDYENQGLLVLGQGYDEGWNAFMLSGNHDTMIAKYLPFIYSKPLEHVKVNSWANGWIIPEGKGSVTIVFWPQYLEWGGMILGFSALFIVTIFSLKKSKNKF